MIKAIITNIEKGNPIAYEGTVEVMERSYNSYHIEIRVDRHLRCIFDDVAEENIKITQEKEEHENMILLNQKVGEF